MGGPAVHFALIGALLLGLVRLAEPAPVEPERTRIVIPAQRVERAQQEVPRTLGRPPSRQERQAAVDDLVDREILFRYALQLGLQAQPVAQRRLAMIANFLADDTEPRPVAELADQAIELGLHQRDVVFRRIMIDSARRLIRAVMLAREPSRAMLESYLREHADGFRTPAMARISHVTVNRLAHGAATEERAQALLETLRQGSIAPEDAGALGDDSFVDFNLPALPDSALARRFGPRFVDALRSLPTGVWSGPVPSRYGLHLVYVHERAEPRLPLLEEVHSRVRAALKEELAEQWLELRLQQLRREFDVVVQDLSS